MAKFAQTAPKLEFKAGNVEGIFYEAKSILTIAEIPSRDELLSRLLGSLKSPASNLQEFLQITEKKSAA